MYCQLKARLFILDTVACVVYLAHRMRERRERRESRDSADRKYIDEIYLLWDKQTG